MTKRKPRTVFDTRERKKSFLNAHIHVNTKAQSVMCESAHLRTTHRGVVGGTSACIVYNNMPVS